LANKFQKSVSARTEVNSSQTEQTEKTDEIKSSKPSGRETNITEILNRETQRTAKNKTFYLDEAVITALRKTAKEQNVTDSKLVNDILRHVLNV